MDMCQTRFLFKASEKKNTESMFKTEFLKS